MQNCVNVPKMKKTRSRASKFKKIYRLLQKIAPEFVTGNPNYCLTHDIREGGYYNNTAIKSAGNNIVCVGTYFLKDFLDTSGKILTVACADPAMWILVDSEREMARIYAFELETIGMFYQFNGIIDEAEIGYDEREVNDYLEAYLKEVIDNLRKSKGKESPYFHKANWCLPHFDRDLPNPPDRESL